MGERRGRFVAVRVRGGCNNSTINAMDVKAADGGRQEQPNLAIRARPFFSPSRLTESHANCGMIDGVAGELPWFDLVCPAKWRMLQS